MTWQALPLDWPAFAGDGLLEKEVSRLAGEYGIQTAVETGTHQGATTRALAAMVPAVCSIETRPASYAEACARLADLPHVRVYHGASQDVLPVLLPHIKRPALYFLDAHWDGNYPLPEEIGIIAAHDPQPVIVIHDMTVPGHPEYQRGDPQPNGAPYDFEYVRSALEKIQAPWSYYYNEAAEGLKVGVLFVVPDGPVP